MRRLGCSILWAQIRLPIALIFSICYYICIGVISIAMNTRSRKAVGSLLIASFVLSPIAPVFAQDAVDQPVATSSDEQVVSSSTPSGTLTEASTTASSSDSYPDTLASTSTQIESPTEPVGEVPIDNISPAPIVQQQVEPSRAPPVKTKFKKDSTQSEQTQLAAVRQHLIDNGLPQEIIDRLDAFQASEQQR